MYEAHYGLTGKPFALTPDPRFWVDTATHRKAMAYLGYGLAQGEGFIVVTGDIGAGKTTLVGHLMNTLDRARLQVVQLVSTQVEPEDMLRVVASGMGVDVAGLAKSELLKAVERQLHATARAGKRTLLIVDEVQALPDASLEELRMLSNFQGAGQALLQILLLGQPEFRARLNDPALEQLRQRVIALHHLDAMEAEEVDQYLAHRLSVVGWAGRPDFDEAAVAAMYAWSEGVPRRLNQLANRILLHGAMEAIDTFTAADVAEVIADMTGDLPAKAETTSAKVIEWPIATEPRPKEAAEVAEQAELRSCDDDGLELHAGTSDQPDLPPSREQHVQDVLAADAPATDDALALRLATLETRLEEQDEALRRVLTLLVDWVEQDSRRAPAERRDTAA